MKTSRYTGSLSIYRVAALVAVLVVPLHVAVSAPPTVAIESPAGPVTVFKGQSLVLKGHAVDSVTGNDTSGQQLAWSSDLDGPLGDGPSVEVFLSAGTHTVSLTATNDQGEVALATVVVTVERQ